jgi:secreted trypsin-like serine protease
LRRIAAVAAWLIGILLTAAVPALASRDDGRAAPRVVGGTGTGITAVPYQAALVRAGMSTFDGQYCGAVVLDARHVVTAAHCVHADDPPGTLVPAASLRVMAGTAHLRKPAETTPGPTEVQVGVSAIHADPAYDAGTSDHDVAVLTLAAPLYTGTPAIDGTTAVAPIPLATAAQTAASVAALAPATLSGWGYTADLADSSSPKLPENFPEDLQAGTQHLVSDGACDAAYAQPITANMVCAGGGGDPAACNGDSGGPLAAAGDSGPVLTGLVSFGIPCHHPASPDVYTRVGAPDVASFIAASLAAPVDEPVVTTTTSYTTTTTVTQTTTTAPPDPPADVAGPGQHIVRMRCERLVCVLNVEVTDPLPSAGIKALETIQRWYRRVPCATSRSGCLKHPYRYIRARPLGAGRYSVTAPRLRGRPSRLVLRGLDQAAKRAYRATVVDVPKLRGS